MKNTDLKQWRKDHDCSQAKLAVALKVAVMTVSRWETGLRSIPPFLHLALRCLELERGETAKGKAKARTKRAKKK